MAHAFFPGFFPVAFFAVKIFFRPGFAGVFDGSTRCG